MKPTFQDRIISVLAYFTFGIFSIIWIVFANMTRKTMSSFLVFNLYQAVFIAVVLAVISLVYSIAVNLLSVIPFIGNFSRWFDIILNQTPMYFTFTITGFFVTLLVIYLSVLSLLGRKPYIPFVSDIIASNFGG